MNIRNRARTLALASLLALAVTSIPQGDALAESKCTPTTCGTKTCSYDGQTYTGGDVRSRRHPITGRTVYYMCDGFTGTWVVAASSKAPSSETVSPSLPTTNRR